VNRSDAARRRWQDPAYRAKQHAAAAANRRTWQERFWEKVNKDGPVPEYHPELGPCWIWTGAKGRSGYGSYNPGLLESEGSSPAYRLAYKLLVGPIPKGLTIDHLCRVHACVKAIANEQGPAHLEAVTMRVNILRGEGTAAVNAAKTHCIRGHPFDAENTYFYGKNRQHRRCRACKRETWRAWHARTRPQRQPPKPRPLPTHCPHGHEFTPENTVIYNGARGCRECRRRNAREWHRRKYGWKPRD
jgi:hypothetical protein